MDSLDAFAGHLRRIAERAARLTPRVVSMRPKTIEGRTVVSVEIDACPVALSIQLFRTMEEFCRREGLPPDFCYSNRTALPPEFRQDRVSEGELPAEWPPTAKRASGP